MADVLRTERPVDTVRADPADPQAPDRLHGHQPSLRQSLHEPEHLEAAGPEPVRELRAGEHAAVQARHPPNSLPSLLTFSYSVLLGHWATPDPTRCPPAPYLVAHFRPTPAQRPAFYWATPRLPVTPDAHGRA